MMNSNLSILKELTKELNKKDEELESKIEELKVANAKMKVLLNNVPASIFYKDVNSVYIACNKHFADRVGVPIKDIAGKTDYDFIQFKNIADGFYYEDVSIIESRKPLLNRQTCYTKEDGSLIWEESSKIPYCNEKGEVIGLVGITIDITDKKLLESEKDNIEFKQTFISANISDIVWEIVWAADSDLKFVYVNKSVERLLGYNSKEILEIPFEKLLSKNSYKSFKKIILKKIEDVNSGKNNDQIVEELEIVRKDGSYAWFEVRVTPVVKDKRFAGAIGVCCDIDKKKRDEIKGRTLKNRRSSDRNKEIVESGR